MLHFTLMNKNYTLQKLPSHAGHVNPLTAATRQVSLLRKPPISLSSKHRVKVFLNWSLSWEASLSRLSWEVLLQMVSFLLAPPQRQDSLPGREKVGTETPCAREKLTPEPRKALLFLQSTNRSLQVER